MNGYQSRNIDNNDDSGTESNPLVTITDMGAKIDAYVAAIKELVNNSLVLSESDSNKKNAAKIEELKAILKYQRERLIGSVERYGVCNPELGKALAEHNRSLTSLELKLAQLKTHLNTIEPVSIITKAEEVAESVRVQISCALEFAYS